jgi:RNA-directed DNA polymerase
VPQKINNTWEQICTFDSLYTAWREVKRGKSERGLVLRYENDLVSNLERVLESLDNGTYRPRPHYEFTLRDTKARLIHAPHLEDRIVQHAVCNAIRFPVQNKLIHHTYSCLIGRGVHKCSEQLSHYLSTGRYKYYLKADVSKFFYSIDHDRLMSEVLRVFKCRRTIAILELFVRVNGTSRGIPIGASTSQILANLALNPLDHYARRELGIDTYLRYCDDMVAVFEDRDQAVEALTGIGHRLNSLGLALNPCSHIGPCSAGIDWVGYRHWSGYRLIRKSTIRRIRKKLRAGPLDHDSLMSYLSHGLRTASLDHLCRLCSFCRAYSISRWLKAR